MSKEENFQFKGGLFTLTLLQLKSVDLHLLEKGLKRKIAQSPAFFDQIPVIVDLEAIDTRDLLDLIWLKNLLVNLSIIPVALQNVPKHLLERAKNADWAILNDLKYQPKSLEESIEKPEKTEELATAVHSSERLESIPCETGLTTTQIRSGQQLYQEKGDMIVVNTVNVGAEILADGNIHIYGALRGRALAGVNGNRDARIFCQSLEAELVSIAGKYRVIEEFSAEWKGRAVQIYLDDDELKIEPLN